MSVASFLKAQARSALYRVGLLGLLHRWRNRDALTVLMFHRVLPVDSPAFQLAEREFTFSTVGFDRCLDFVERHYNVVRLQDVLDTVKGRTPLPPNPMLITFDDGWRDTSVHAEPLLRKHKMTAVLFLSTEVPYLQGARWWQDALVEVLGNKDSCERLQVAINSVKSTVLPEEPVEAGRVMNALLASFPEPMRLDLLERALPGVFASIAERQMLTQAELLQLDGGCIELGGHGHTHAPLTRVADAQTELNLSREELDVYWNGPASMSFPHGAVDAELVRQARIAGFELLFTSEPTLSLLDRFKSSMGRIHVPENRWTCTRGRVDDAKLATFLFFRPSNATVHQGEAV